METARQFAFAGVRQGFHQGFGRHQTEHAIAEEFQAFVIGHLAGALGHRGMGQGQFEQFRIAKGIAEIGLQGIYGLEAEVRLFRWRHADVHSVAFTSSLGQTQRIAYLRTLPDQRPPKRIWKPTLSWRKPQSV